VVLSGFRARPIHGRRRSYHLRGMAADVYVEGVSTMALREYAMSLGVRGVGFYPRSGFVHVDVRPERYYWVDASSPSRRRPARPTAPDELAGAGRPRSAVAGVVATTTPAAPAEGHDR